MNEEGSLPPEPAYPSYVSAIMEYGLHEKGRKYSEQEARELYQEGRDAGLDRLSSREDAEEMAEVTAEHSRWEILRNKPAFEDKLKSAQCQYDFINDEMRQTCIMIAQELDMNILSSYQHIASQYRCLEYDAVYESQDVAPRIKVKLVKAESDLRNAIREFESRFNEIYKGKAGTLEEAFSDAGIQTAGEYQQKLQEIRQGIAKREREREEHAAAGQGCGCLVAVAPIAIGTILFIGEKALW